MRLRFQDSEGGGRGRIKKFPHASAWISVVAPSAQECRLPCSGAAACLPKNAGKCLIHTYRIYRRAPDFSFHAPAGSDCSARSGTMCFSKEPTSWLLDCWEISINSVSIYGGFLIAR